MHWRVAERRTAVLVFLDGSGDAVWQSRARICQQLCQYFATLVGQSSSQLQPAVLLVESCTLPHITSICISTNCAVRWCLSAHVDVCHMHILYWNSSTHYQGYFGDDIRTRSQFDDWCKSKKNGAEMHDFSIQQWYFFINDILSMSAFSIVC